MKKILFVLMLLSLASSFSAYSVEERFRNGCELIYSTINLEDREESISLYKKDQVAYFRNDTAFVVAVTFDHDLDPFWRADELQHLPIEGQFAYDIAEKIIYASAGKLYESYWKDEAWTAGKSLKIKMKDKKDVASNLPNAKDIQAVFNPTLTKDGKRLFFSAVSDGQVERGLDLWCSELNGKGEWEKPRHLGFDVNSDANEDFPFVVGDTLLYFSSDRPGGLGWDLYYIDLREQNPKVKFSVLSTVGDELGLVIVEDRVHVISNKRGNNDIYKAQLPPRKRKSVKSGDAAAKAENKKTDSVVNLKKAESEGKEVQADIPEEKKDSLYIASIKSAAENESSEKITENISGTFDKRIFYFDLNDDRLSSRYDKDFDQLMDFINKNPDKRFLISGFTDERGTEEYNLELSKRRAKRVYNVLCKRGVNPKRLMFVGLGTQGLVIKNAKKESEHQKNRRVEIRLVD